jgi:uncharacterized protein YbjT (DUF2867 family)
MNSKQMIVVVGATGAQGGGLARAILNDTESTFSVRAITRNPESDKARELAGLGAEIVTADLDDAIALKNAFKGAYGAYCVTNFWEHFSPETEIAQASRMADAAKAGGLKHVIWSTLEDTRRWIPLSDDRMPTLMGKYKVPHLDAKGEANRQFTDRSIPVTFLLTSFYWENFMNPGMAPQHDANGVLTITLPMGDQKLPGIATEDIGRCAYGVFRQPVEYTGKTVGIAGEHLKGTDMAAALSVTLGEKVKYQSVEPSAFREFGFPGAADLGNMFQFKRDFNDEFCAARSVRESRSLNPELQTFSVWLARNKDRIPVAT